MKNRNQSLDTWACYESERFWSKLEKLKNKKDKRLFKIISMRLDGRTFKEIGKNLKITGGRVSQLEYKALLTLMHL